MLKSKKLSLTAVLALLGATLVAPPAWAGALIVPCTLGGTFEIEGTQVTRSTGCIGSAVIPKSVTSIDDGIFQETALTSVTFEVGSLLNEIRYDAFRDSTLLTSVTFGGNAPNLVGADAFTNVAVGAVANIGSTATGFVVDSNGLWFGLIVVRAGSASATPAPYTGPLLQDFSSRTLDPCKETSITITGSRLLDVVPTIQGKSVTVLESTATKLVLAFPAGLTPGQDVDLVINSSSGTLTHQDAFDIPADTCAAEVSEGRWTQLQSDGKTVKIYAKDPIGDGKIQFFVDGEEIAWVNAIDEADTKLSYASSNPYLVRSVELKPGKNRFEIKLDGVRVWRATYVPKG